MEVAAPPALEYMAKDADYICTSAVAIASSYVFMETYGDKLSQEDWAKVKVRLMSACREHANVLQRFTRGVDELSNVKPNPVSSYDLSIEEADAEARILDTAEDEAEVEAHALDNAA